MPIIPPADDNPDFGSAFENIPTSEENELDSGYDMMEEMAESVAVDRQNLTKQLGYMRWAYGWLLPTLFVIWFLASLTFLFLTGFGVNSFKLHNTVEIASYVSLVGPVSIPTALIVLRLFGSESPAAFNIQPPFSIPRLLNRAFSLIRSQPDD